MLLALASWPRFCLLFWAPGLTIGLAVGETLSMRVKIAVSLSGFSL